MAATTLVQPAACAQPSKVLCPSGTGPCPQLHWGIMRPPPSGQPPRACRMHSSKSHMQRMCAAGSPRHARWCGAMQHKRLSLGWLQRTWTR